MRKIELAVLTLAFLLLNAVLRNETVDPWWTASLDAASVVYGRGE